MKRSLALLTAALLSVGATACGGASHQTSSSQASSSAATATAASNPTPSHGYLNDGDDDNFRDHKPNGDKSYHDSDDSRIVTSSRAANAADKRVITAFVKRYYAAFAAGDGMKICSMLFSRLAESVVEDYGEAPGPSYLRGGRSCPAVMKMLSKHYRARLVGTVEVTSVYANGDNALVLLGSATMPASDASLEREHGAWKMAALMGDVLP